MSFIRDRPNLRSGRANVRSGWAQDLSGLSLWKPKYNRPGQPSISLKEGPALPSAARQRHDPRNHDTSLVDLSAGERGMHQEHDAGLTQFARHRQTLQRPPTGAVKCLLKINLGT